MNTPAERVAQRWMEARAKETAAEAYDRLDHDITDMLKRIPKLRVQHRRSFEGGRMPYRNWGFPGDLGHIKEQLTDLLRSYGG